MDLAQLGKQLDDAGWAQGVLLPVVSYGVAYHPDVPVTTVSKKAANSLPASLSQSTGLTRHGLAIGASKVKDRLVVTSQTCDIVKPVEEEPTIMAMRAFFTDKPKIRDMAARNSTRQFLLDPERGLVVDATVIAVIEKPLLTTLTREVGAPDDTMRRRFAQWLARRFDRPALDDDVVAAVVKPILDNLRSMEAEDDPQLSALEPVLEVRLARIAGTPPFDVRLLFIVPEGGLPDGGLALGRLVTRMRNWFSSDAASLQAWDARHYYETAVGDYLDTDRLYLDEYTYRGRTVRGLGHRSFG